MAGVLRGGCGGSSTRILYSLAFSFSSRLCLFFFLVHLLRFVVSVALRFHLFLLAWSVLFSSFCYSEWLAGLGLAEV